MRRRALTLLAVLAAAASAAACGGTDHSRADYAKALNAAQADLAQRFTALQRRITATSTPAQQQATLLAYEAAVRTTLQRLRAVDPPEGFDGLHRRLVGEVGEYGTALRQARTQVRRGQAQETLAAQGRLRTAITRTGERLDATIRAINDKLAG